MEDVTAFILAGGRSTRMGADKAFLQLEGRTLLARAVELAQTVTPTVVLVGDQSRLKSCGPVVEDRYRDRGPLGGIHAALAATRTELNLVLAVDLPFLEPRFLEYLVAQARAAQAVVTAPRAGGGWQPLCAVYRRAFLKVAEDSLREGRNKVDSLFAEVETRVIEEDELLRLGFAAAMFRNLNTPAELERARKKRRGHRER